MISICIATYNGEEFILNQLQSILSQIKPNDEIIISDDGSVDSTLKIIEEIADNRIKVFKNKNRNGPIGNFENALKNSSGEVIFLSDQDDEWLSGKLESHLNMHKEYDLVISDAIIVNNSNNITKSSYFLERNSRSGILHNLKKNCYIGCCMSFNRKILNYSIPFPSKIHMHDWWIGIVAEAFGNVYFLNEPFLKYRRHTNNASPNLGESNYSVLKRIQNRINIILPLIYLKLKS
jgi:glycosyltransferase involved in cell wall biosynthesis